MRVTERVTPVAAVIAALSTLACCLPFAFLGALGLAGASVGLQTARPWLLASAGIFLVVGFVQLYVRRNQCQRLCERLSHPPPDTPWALVSAVPVRAGPRAPGCRESHPN